MRNARPAIDDCNLHDSIVKFSLAQDGFNADERMDSEIKSARARHPMRGSVETGSSQRQ
jgi:hypothetical protein